MKLINIGFGNMVNADRVIGIVSPDSAPIKRVLIMDSDHVILSGIPLESITGRFAQEEES